MSLYHQYIQGNISKEELIALTGVDMDSEWVNDFVEIRYIDDYDKPTSDWTIVTRFFATGMAGKIEVGELKK